MLQWTCAAMALLANCTAQAPSAADARPAELRPAELRAQAPASGDRPVAAASDARRVHWQRSVEDAQELARRTGRPLLLALNMDGESASDRIWHENYRDPRFVELTRRCVCVGASVFRHNATDHDEHGRRIPCPRFAGLVCGEHVALEPELFRVWFQDENRVAPRHVLVRPDGTVAFDLSLMFDLQDIDRAIAAEVDGLGPWCELPGQDWAELARRRDVVGRTALEHAVARIDDPATLAAALDAIAAHGDAGALPALRLLAERAPDAPLARLADVASELGLDVAFANVLRGIAQRPGPVPGDLARPPAFASVVRLLAARDDPNARAWLCALAATDVPGDDTVTAALRTVFGDGIDAEQAVHAVRFDRVLAAGERAARGHEALPVPRPELVARELRTAEQLRERLTTLDAELAGDDDAAETLAAAGIASLDLGRVDLEQGGSSALLLFEDAARLLARAIDAEPDRGAWLLEASRTAYYRQDFAAERAYGVRALAARGYTWPPEAERWPQLLQDRDAVEALRWIGDGAARELAGADLTTGDGAVAAIATMRTGLLALALAAVSPSGRGRDFVTASSFAESLGLVREEGALLACGLRRLPGDADLHGASIAAMWRTGRFETAAALAERALRSAPSAEGSWWAAYANVVTAEELRRRERPAAAVAHYDRAVRLFADSERQNPAYAASIASYRALCGLGSGHALAQGADADRRRAADALVAAAALPVDLPTLRDGLGYDAVDLVDKVLEWRIDGPSPVYAVTLLDRLGRACEGTPTGVAFWAAAVSDSALREALRADGRNAERRMADTVDAAGLPIRMEMGLPTRLGDRYLAAAIATGERAANAAGAGDEERRVLAQALTIRAERELVRGRTDGVEAALRRAAKVLNVELPGPPRGGSRIDALRALVRPLRERLGPARPRMREGR